MSSKYEFFNCRLNKKGQLFDAFNTGDVDDGAGNYGQSGWDELADYLCKVNDEYGKPCFVVRLDNGKQYVLSAREVVKK